MVSTCAEALREAVTELGRVVSTREVIDQIYKKYPNKPWKKSTIRAHLIGCSVNHSSSHHYPSFPKFLFTVDKGKVRLHNPEIDGKWVVDNRGARRVDITKEVGAIEEKETKSVEESTLSLERDLESFIFQNLSSMENGLNPYEGSLGRQYSVKSGRIDILAKDKDSNFVVLEIKAGTVNDSALTQILSYMADIKHELAGQKQVRGIIVGYDFSDKLVSASSLIPNVELKKYRVKFEFEKA